MNPKVPHIPVLLQEVLKFLDPEKGGNYIDGTLGCGGHAEAILRRNQSIQLLGIDQDSEVLEIAKRRLAPFGPRAQIRKDVFSQVKELASSVGFETVSGILLDLGVSSVQLDSPHRGFSFQQNGPLDMRMNPTSTFSARDLLDQVSEKELCKILRIYGEEPKAKKIARAIKEEDGKVPIRTTAQLSEVIRKNSRFYGRGYPKSVTRCFQAIRIAVNDELKLLETAIDNTIDLLCPGGRLVIISFHSLEDRIVKNKFKYEALECICPPGFPVCCCDKKVRVKQLTPKPIQPGQKEQIENRRSHSAKLRAIEKLETSEKKSNLRNFKF